MAAGPAGGAGRESRLERLQLWLATRRVRWRAAIAMLLGALAALALPPFHVIPALVPAFVGFTWLIDHRMASRRVALALGWCFGFGFFLAGLYWISNAFAARGPALAWAGPPAVIGLAALLAGFTALAALMARLAGQRGIGAVLVLALAWTGTEWLRGVVFTGFPWNLIGSVWTVSEAMIQVTALTGTGALGLVTVIAAAMPAALAGPLQPGRREAGACLLALAVLVLIWVGGAVRLELAGDPGEVAGVRLRLVQPSIPQALKWSDDLLEPSLEAQIALSRTGALPEGSALPWLPAEAAAALPPPRWDKATPPTVVIWSETAAPLLLDEDPRRLGWVSIAAPPDGVVIVGTMRRQWVGGTSPIEFRNTLHVINDAAEIVATYDKVHLVPFGEYVPFRSILAIAKLTTGDTDLSPGPGLTTISLGGLPPFSPLICYEVIFPGAVVAPGARPGWLLNLTNDAWYGISTGPYQHFAAARLRAVEEGLPLVRVANTGISAVIDSHGRIVASLGLEAVGVVDAPLPVALAGPTPYHRFGEAVLVVLCILLGLVVVQLRQRPTNHHRQSEG